MIQSFLYRLFVERWQRKLMALVIAIIAWTLMHQAITTTKTIADVPVKVVNLPPGKTVEGLLPSGYLDHKLTLTLVGSRSVIDQLEPSDLEVVINAEGKEGQWIVHADKKSLVSKNPALDLRRSLKDVLQNEFIVNLTPLVTEQVPVIILKPLGSAPPGYQFLDVWPQFLTETVTGPEKEVQMLKNKGIKVVFDLSLVTQEELDKLSSSEEEVSFYVPESWKKVTILNDTVVSLNDPEAATLRMNFLKRTFLSLDTFIPIALYFPLETLKTYNPDKIQLASSPLIRKENGLSFLSEPLYAKDVSSLFLEVVRDHLQLVIVASNKDYLAWSIDFVDLKDLEKTYVALALAEHPGMKDDYLSNRFHTYVDQFRLFTNQKQPLALHPILQESHILIQ